MRRLTVSKIMSQCGDQHYCQIELTKKGFEGGHFSLELMQKLWIKDVLLRILKMHAKSCGSSLCCTRWRSIPRVSVGFFMRNCFCNISFFGEDTKKPSIIVIQCRKGLGNRAILNLFRWASLSFSDQ